MYTEDFAFELTCSLLYPVTVRARVGSISEAKSSVMKFMFETRIASTHPK